MTLVTEFKESVILGWVVLRANPNPRAAKKMEALATT